MDFSSPMKADQKHKVKPKSPTQENGMEKVSLFARLSQGVRMNEEQHIKDDDNESFVEDSEWKSDSEAEDEAGPKSETSSLKDAELILESDVDLKKIAEIHQKRKPLEQILTQPRA